MEAQTNYNDFIGTAAADFNFSISKLPGANKLEAYEALFQLNTERFKLVGFSIGSNKGRWHLHLQCINKMQDGTGQRRLINMEYVKPLDGNILDALFEKFQITLYRKTDTNYVD